MEDKSAQERLMTLGITLPSLPVPLANYVSFVIEGNCLFLSGQGPQEASGNWLVGKVGEKWTVDEAYQHARLTGIRILSIVQSALGSLDRVKRVVKLLGFVNASSEFADHPKVINGCSDLMVDVFGERGRHARSAVGVNSLPEGISVEIESIFEINMN